MNLFLHATVKNNIPYHFSTMAITFHCLHWCLWQGLLCLICQLKRCSLWQQVGVAQFWTTVAPKTSFNFMTKRGSSLIACACHGNWLVVFPQRVLEKSSGFNVPVERHPNSNWCLWCGNNLAWLKSQQWRKSCIIAQLLLVLISLTSHRKPLIF